MAASVPQIAIDAVAHYLGKGISKDVAVGLVAVLYAGESRLQTGGQDNAATDKGGVLAGAAYGIASWNGDRQTALNNFAKARGLPVADLNTQLDFVLTESANSYPKVWAAIQNPATTYTDFIAIFVKDYEIPKDPQSEIDRAMALAPSLYAAAVTPAPAPKPAPVVPPAPTPSPSPVPPVVTPSPQPQAAQMEAILAALEPVIVPIIAPLVESVIAGLARGLLSQVMTQPPTTTALPSNFAADLAAELAKLLPKA